MSLDAFRLDGKNALVTGSHRGIGAAIAVALAGAGANVVCHGRAGECGEVCEEIRRLGRKAGYVAGDVADEAGCRELIGKNGGGLGAVGILVDKAGMNRRAAAAGYSPGREADVAAGKIPARI